MTITMYDSITASVLPSRGDAYAGYVDGNWPSFGAVAQRFYPRAHCLSITVEGNRAACLDIEPGNRVAPSQAGAWVRAMLRANVWRPCIYAPESEMAEVRASLAGIPRGSYRLWVASWPGGGPIVPEGYDAHQYTDHGPHGENYDISVCRDDFFPARPAPKPKPKPPPKPHPKIAAAAIAGAFTTALEALIHGTAGWHPPPTVASAIGVAAAVIAGYLKRSTP